MTKEVSLKGKLNATGPAALAARPKLSSLMTAVFLRWSMAEQNIGMMFVLLLDSNADDALDLFLAFNDLGPKQTAMKALAKKKLSEELYKEIENMLGTIRNRSKARNAIVHGLWAVSDEFPEYILKIDEKEFNRRFLIRIDRARNGDAENFSEDFEYDSMIFSAYSESDFKSSIDMLNRLSSLTQNLALKISTEIFDATNQRRAPQAPQRPETSMAL